MRNVRGRLASNTPNAMGSRSKGSNFLTIAKYNKPKAIIIIIIDCGESAANPESPNSFIIDSINTVLPPYCKAIMMSFVETVEPFVTNN